MRRFCVIGKGIFFHKSSLGVHQQLINDLKSSRDVNIRKVAYILQACKLERQEADYELSASYGKSRAQNVINMVEKIFIIINSMNIP